MRETKDSEERKQEFVDVAEKLFKENGIVDTTVNNIVKELDVAKGLFYYYFKSKDDVIDAISEKYKEAFAQSMQQSMNDLNWHDAFDQLILNSIQSFLDMNVRLMGDNDEVDLSQLSRKSQSEAEKTCKDAMIQMLREGNEKKEISVENPEYVGAMITGGISYLVSIGLTDKEIIKELIWKLIREEI